MLQSCSVPHSPRQECRNLFPDPVNLTAGVVSSYPMKKILLVADLVPVVEREKSVLSRSDVVIFTATSGEEALRIHREQKVDLIVSDLDMPGTGGDGLCSVIRRDDALKSVSIILVCLNRKSDIERYEASGANACLTKPLDMEELSRRVNQLLQIPVRESMRVLVKVSVKGEFRSDYFFAYSRNISVSGILLETDKVLVKGDRILCTFFLVSDQVTADGEVARTMRKSLALNQYGVKFIDLPPEAKALIAEFIARHRKH